MIGKKKLIRLGLIGTGPHMKENLLPAIGEVGGFCIRGVASSSEEKARTLARNLGCNIATGSWIELNRSDEIDALIVSATPQIHAEAIAASSESGKPIFVEKPPAESLEKLITVMNHEQCVIDFNIRFSEPLDRLYHYAGDKSALRMLKIRCLSSKPLLPLWGYHSVLKSYLMAVAIHAIDLAVDFLGKPDDITASLCKINDNKFSLIVSMSRVDRSVMLELGNYWNEFMMTIEMINSNATVAILSNQRRIAVAYDNIGSAHEQRLSKEWTTFEWSGLRGGYRLNGYYGSLLAFQQMMERNEGSPSSLLRCVPVFEVIDRILELVDEASFQS